jgi:general secretion pathway protein G
VRIFKIDQGTARTLLPMNKRLALVCLFWFVLVLTGEATSSRSGKTRSDLASTATYIELLRLEKGRLPTAAEWDDQIQGQAGLETYPVVQDAWGRRFIYLAPGKHGDFDLYSAGANGLDEMGKGDDISVWAGTNDGFYDKRNWPVARRVAAAGFFLASSSLLLARWLTWWVVRALSGSLLIATGMTVSVLVPAPSMLFPSWRSLMLIPCLLFILLRIYLNLRNARPILKEAG